jgi:GAF domain-containing protein
MKMLSVIRPRLLNTLALNVSGAGKRPPTETQRHGEQMAAIAEVGQSQPRGLPPSGALELVHACFHAPHSLEAAFHQTSLSPPRLAVNAGAEQGCDILGKGITGSIAQSGMAEVIDDLASDPRAIHVEGTPDVEEVPETMMCAPLNAGGKTIGLLSVYRDRPEGLFTQVDRISGRTDP